MRKLDAAFLKASKRKGKFSAASGGLSSEVTKKIWAYIKEHNLQENAAERPIFSATLEPRHFSRAQIAAMVKTVRDKF